MKIPAIEGVIDRRILVNYRVDRETLDRYLPEPFQPKTFDGYGIAGICLIRLKNIRMKGLPRFLGISSENGAHRIAVEWFDSEQGVYIPRRDTDSFLNSVVGGRLFPGEHHLARFSVSEGDGSYNVGFTSNDNTSLEVKAKETSLFPSSSIFGTLEAASRFFEQGSVGYSPKEKGYDGIELRTFGWEVSPLDVEYVFSSYFENEYVFPVGSIEFDHALLMKNIEHEWHSRENICSC